MEIKLKILMIYLIWNKIFQDNWITWFNSWGSMFVFYQKVSGLLGHTFCLLRYKVTRFINLLFNPKLGDDQHQYRLQQFISVILLMYKCSRQDCCENLLFPYVWTDKINYSNGCSILFSVYGICPVIYTFINAH